MSSDWIEASREVRAPMGEEPAVMASFSEPHPWAIVLAGGDGTRLQDLTLKIAGDSRPKQFCSIFGGESLLAQTRARIASLFPLDRELFVVTGAHEMYYRKELHGVDDSRIIRQPLNRGTGVAVALALLHILQCDVDPVFVLVPCDHYYADAEAFCRAVRSALSGAEQYPDSVVLLGAEADYAETEYGWIELGSPISPAPVPLLRVNRFWEKPSLPQARTLLRRGCVWNTFVTVGHASTLLELLCAQVPNVVQHISTALAENNLEAAYNLIPPVDLSRQILAPQPHRLLVVRDKTSGWADLGSPRRVRDILARHNVQPAWLSDVSGQSPAARPDFACCEAARPESRPSQATVIGTSPSGENNVC